MQLYHIASLFRQINEIKLGLTIDTQIILITKMNFCPPVSCADFVSFDNGKIDISHFKTGVASSLDIHISIDVAQSGITFAVILCILRQNRQRNTKHHNHQKRQCFFHLWPPRH